MRFLVVVIISVNCVVDTGYWILCGGYWILLISLRLQVVSRWSHLSSRIQRASQVERNDHLFGLCTTKICWNNLKIMSMIITGNLHTSVPLQGGEWRTHERQRCWGGEGERRRMQIANVGMRMGKG